MIQMFSFRVKIHFGKHRTVWIILRLFVSGNKIIFLGGKHIFPPASYFVEVQGFVTPPDFRVTCIVGVALSSTFRFEPRKMNGERLTLLRLPSPEVPSEAASHPLLPTERLIPKLVPCLIVSGARGTRRTNPQSRAPLEENHTGAVSLHSENSPVCASAHPQGFSESAATCSVSDSAHMLLVGLLQTRALH